MIGTDSSVWTFVIGALVLSAILGWITKRLLKKYLDFEAFRVWYVILAVGIMCGLWLLFGAFGPGQPVELTPAERDGIRDINIIAPEMPTKEEIEASQEEKKSAIIQKIEENLDAGPIEDDYIQKAIKRFEQMNVMPMIGK